LATPKGAAPLWHDTTFFFLDLESYTHGRFHRPWISSRSRPQCGMIPHATVRIILYWTADLS